MTQDDIIKMARDAGCEYQNEWGNYEFCIEDLEAFAKLVAAKEREACAKVCIEHGKVWGERMLFGFQATLDDAAEAIRARGLNG